MRPAYSLRDVLRSLADRPHVSTDGRHLFVGLLLCRPELPAARDALFPSLRYFHQRSGPNADFHFGGFTDRDPHSSFARRIDTAPHGTWWFDEEVFNSWRRQIEAVSSWRYSGGNDIILTTSVTGPDGPGLSLTQAIAFSLERISDEGGIGGISGLFEAIFRFAETYDGKTPMIALSDRLARTEARNLPWDAGLAFLPESLRRHAKAIRPFALGGVMPAQSIVTTRYLETVLSLTDP